MSVLEAWAGGGVHEVVLPSGLRVKGRIPESQDIVVGQLAPSTLITAAMALMGKPLDELSDGERSTWVRWQRVLAANFIREVWDPATEQWQPATVTADMLETAPPEDTDALEDIVLRRQTPAQVTAHSRFAAGEITREEWLAVVNREAAGTVNAWSSFRPQPVRDDRGEDGPDVERAPVKPSRAERRARRPRGGPGAGAAAAL